VAALGAGTILALAAAEASAQSLATPGSGAPNIRSVSLWYKAQSDTSCPRRIMMRATALTDGPGPVKFIIRKAGGGTSGTLAATAKKQSDGKYVATYTQQFSIEKNTRTKYMAEAGVGKISPWITFDETCGPQPRKETKTKGASPRQGTPLSELDKPSKPKGGGKPLPTAENEPGGGKRLCKGNLSVKRYMAATRAGGIATALAGWVLSARSKYGKAFGRYANASDKREQCKGVPGVFTCTVSARPCRG
jgi:hypothetical protein